MNFPPSAQHLNHSANLRLDLNKMTGIKPINLMSPLVLLGGTVE